MFQENDCEKKIRVHFYHEIRNRVAQNSNNKNFHNTHLPRNILISRSFCILHEIISRAGIVLHAYCTSIQNFSLNLFNEAYNNRVTNDSTRKITRGTKDITKGSRLRGRGKRTRISLEISAVARTFGKTRVNYFNARKTKGTPGSSSRSLGDKQECDDEERSRSRNSLSPLFMISSFCQSTSL